LSRSGGNEINKFCECFDLVCKDETLSVRQEDVLNILEPWRKVVAIDEDELVIIFSRQVLVA
jgi:hypothetical protein